MYPRFAGINIEQSRIAEMLGIINICGASISANGHLSLAWREHHKKEYLLAAIDRKICDSVAISFDYSWRGQD